MAYSFAEQILRTEAYRPDTLFADALRGLYVFGAKTVYPQLLSTFTYTLVPELEGRTGGTGLRATRPC
jgi:hypothetical protein